MGVCGYNLKKIAQTADTARKLPLPPQYGKSMIYQKDTKNQKKSNISLTLGAGCIKIHSA